MSWDNAGISGGGEWNEDATVHAAAENFNGDATGENELGDHENGDNAEGGGGGFSGECFNCGQTGHSKANCTNERVQREFTGTCRLCEEVGHRASDCPSAPPKLCNNCKEEGHSILECKNPRKVEYPHAEDVPAEVAWQQLLAAAEDKDMDDVREAADKYFKACPDATYVDMESAFRTQNIKLYLIALEKELAVTYTNMDLQGNLDKKYSVTWRFSDKPARPKENDIWPVSAEANLVRLEDAGAPVDRGVPKCGNCDELGHSSKYCSQEKMENADRAIVSCYNCSEVGHRMRDCPNPRPDRFACKNCNQSGHSAKECPEPRNPANVTCKICDEKGHFAKDCPTAPPRESKPCFNCGEEGHRSSDCTNEKKIVCRNCDEEGHQSRDCPKPRDYSRVKCMNCQQMGHTKVRCKEPIAEEQDGGNDGGYGGGDGIETNGDAGADNFGADAAPVAAGDWEDGAGGGVGTSQW